MKKIIKIALMLILALNIVGCVGLISGHTYTKSDAVIAYKVIRKGVVVFMTPEQIQRASLNKVDMVVTDTYKVLEGKPVTSK